MAVIDQAYGGKHKMKYQPRSDVESEESAGAALEAHAVITEDLTLTLPIRCYLHHRNKFGKSTLAQR